MRARTWQGLAVVGSMALVAFTSISVHRPFASAAVDPDGQASGTIVTNSSGNTAVFTVYYYADEMDPTETFNLECSATLNIECSVQPTLQLFPNGSDEVTVTFDASSTTGTAYVSLTAEGQWTAASDAGSREYEVVTGVTLTPLDVPSTVIQHSQDNVGRYSVRNNTASGDNFGFSCAWSAEVACTPAGPIWLDAATEDTVDFTFDAGALPASFTLGASVNSENTGADSVALSVTVTDFLSVNAVATNAEVYAVPNTQRTDTFTVRFPGQSAASFAFSCGSGCSVSPSDTLVGDTPKNIRVTYTPGANGTTGTVALSATKSGSSWMTQTGTLKWIATNGILLSVADANPELEMARGECLSVAAGAGQIVCDDFQFVYPFTPVATMNRTRQLGLIYNSALLGPYGVIGANFVLAPGSPEPDSIKATLVVDGTTIRTQSYASTLYAPGVKTRIAFDWSDWDPRGENAFKYSVTLQPWTGGSAGTAVSDSGRVLSLDHYQRFGRGWWIAGLEKLSVHGSDTLVWTGPDASGAAYVKSGDMWVRRSRSVPDTISQAEGAYIRRPLGGGAVYFDSLGYHTKTVDRNGNETHFNDSTIAGWRRLTSVELPKPSGTDTVYTLHYNDTTGTIDSVRVRSGSGGWSTFKVFAHLDSGPPYLDSIAAPDGTKTRFGTSGGLLAAVYGPRGDTTAVSYNSYLKVDEVRVKTAEVADVVLSYEASSLVGRSTAGWSAPRAANQVSSRIDGPLSGAADTTRFYTTGWGAVRGIRDALGNETWIDREDTAFPALPTRVRHPNGWQQTTAYTVGGLPDTIIDRANGAMTTYTWNTTWRKPLTVTSPEGTVTTYTYDGAGNLLTRLVASAKDSVRYASGGRPDRFVDPLGRVTTLTYDARGNLEKVQPPDSAWETHYRDARGLDTMVVSPTGHTGSAHTVTVATKRDAMGRDSVTITTNSLDAIRTIVRTTYQYGQRTKVEPLGVDQLYPSMVWDTIRTGASEWVYDQLGRVKVAITPNKSDTLQYDLAGRLERQITGTDTVTMTYDVLGRMLTRARSRRTYVYWEDTVVMEHPFGGSELTFVTAWPEFHTSGLGAGSAADSLTDEFTYDAMGNLRTARNRYARTTRGYSLNGLLTSEVDSLRNYDASSFGTHVYSRSYVYDREGRRAHLLHPTWINSGSDRTDFYFSRNTGQLEKVIDPLGSVYDFVYFADGQRSKTWFPAGVDSVSYDAGGRRYRHKLNGSYLDSLSYDRGGRVTGFTAGGGQYYYNGLGHLTESYYPSHELFSRDAFGNDVSRHSYSNLQNVGDLGTAWGQVYADNYGGRFGSSVEIWEAKNGGVLVPPPEQWIPSYTGNAYEAATGNLLGSLSENFTWDVFWRDPMTEDPGADSARMATRERTFSRSLYAADGKIGYQQVNRDSIDVNANNFSVGEPWGAFEEYWYDALGRRVLKRTRQEYPICTNSSRCFSAIERFVWDGDQIAWEFRQADSADVMDPNPTPSTGYTGHVGYLNIGGVDEPLSMIRNDTVLVFVRSWARGVMGARTTSGATWGTSVPWSGAGPSHRITGSTYDPNALQAWVGSVPVGQIDATGLAYKRNRFYDTNTGQFTRQDPIGIAGGLNLYGYANGDPINFSDPFGLCPFCAVAYAAFEVGASVYDAVDLAATAIGYARGKVSGAALTATFAGAVAGVVGFGGGGGKAARAGVELADDALVCRGGRCTADLFSGGRGVTLDGTGRLQGVSVNSAPGASLEQLTSSIPNGQVGVTTVGQVRAMGGQVVSTPSATNPLHATLSGLTPQQAEDLFTPTMRNPNR